MAIHEAMEQQTISVAKAGITTVLNSRTSVLAAANPIFGRYDDLKSASENIDLMSTILSRFDLIFIVRDLRDEARDRSIARHVMGVHINASALSVNGEEGGQRHGAGTSSSGASSASVSGAGGGGGNDISGESGDLDLMTIKKFVTYCRTRCAPRLSPDTAALLSSEYVKIRTEMKQRREEQGEAAQAVPITVYAPPPPSSGKGCGWVASVATAPLVAPTNNYPKKTSFYNPTHTPSRHFGGLSARRCASWRRWCGSASPSPRWSSRPTWRRGTWKKRSGSSK